jgi:hypothetical protein
MTNHSSNALRRAKRAFAGAFVLTAAFAAGIVIGHNAPATGQVASSKKQVALVAPSVTHAVAHNSFSAANLIVHASYQNSSTISELPAPASSSGLTGLLRGSVTSPSAAELQMVKILEDQRCLAEAMYYEARGEGRAGEEAIAEVVFHRMRTPGYPHSICGVVFEGAGRKHGCQFSFACDGSLLQPRTSAAWEQARVLAAKIMTGTVQLADITGNAISFHSADIQPGWADHLERTIQIGNHVFYRAASRDDQVIAEPAQDADGSF